MTASLSATPPYGYTVANTVATSRGWVKKTTGELIVGGNFIEPFVGNVTTATNTALTSITTTSGVLTPGARLAGTGLVVKKITSITVGGTNTLYVAVPTASVAASGNSDNITATAFVTMGVDAAAVNAAGTGYTVGDILAVTGFASATLTVATITGGGGTGPIGTVTVSAAGDYATLGTVVGIAVTGGTGINATFDLTFKVNAFTVTNQGFGYAAAPVVTIAGNATGTAVLGTTNYGVRVTAVAADGLSATLADAATGSAAVAVVGTLPSEVIYEVSQTASHRVQYGVTLPKYLD